MDQISNYVNIMVETLKRKKRYLEELSQLTMKQTEVIKDDEFDTVKFDELLDQKETIINNINEIDKGFTSLYNRVKIDINEDLELYKSELKMMQDLITNCVDLGVDVKVQEERNKAKLETVFNDGYKSIRSKANSQRVAKSYINTMSNGQVPGSVFYDTKK